MSKGNDMLLEMVVYGRIIAEFFILISKWYPYNMFFSGEN